MINNSTNRAIEENVVSCNPPQHSSIVGSYSRFYVLTLINGLFRIPQLKLNLVSK